MYENLDDYPGVKPLADGWREVLAELQGILAVPFAEWPETDLYKGSWQVFGLYAFGEKHEQACSMCPRTTALVEAVPGMWTAGFSKLQPGTIIRPHRGYSGEVLRFHLGLIGGDDCALRVGEEVRGWHPGSAFIFDDTQEHEAWNKGDKDRIVLLLDFRRDPNSTAAIEGGEDIKA